MGRVGTPYIAQAARSRGLDPKAVLAVAGREGLGGGIGDQGTSFGPWQLHQGGALPGSIPLSNAQSWAWSPAGVNYALDAQAKVAGGLSGRAAIENIVRRFERPADPGSEVAGALKLYGGHLASVGGPAKEQAEFSPMRSPVGGGSEDRRSALLKWALGASDSFIQGKEMPSLSNLLATVTASQRGNQSLTANNVPTKGSRKLAGISNLPAAVPGAANRIKWIGKPLQGENPHFLNLVAQAAMASGATSIDVNSGYRSPEHNAAVGGVSNSNHTYGHAVDADAFVPGQGWVPLGTLLRGTAEKFGLRSGDQPGFYHGGRDTVHVDDAYNLRT